MGKYREFWVSFEGMSFRTASENFVEKNETNDCVHVIEYQALVDAQKEIDRLKEKLEFAQRVLVSINKAKNLNLVDVIYEVEAALAQLKDDEALNKEKE
jgi:hypothetical protein